jgi:hypothetical protein
LFGKSNLEISVTSKAKPKLHASDLPRILVVLGLTIAIAAILLVKKQLQAEATQNNAARPLAWPSRSTCFNNAGSQVNACL